MTTSFNPVLITENYTSSSSISVFSGESYPNRASISMFDTDSTIDNNTYEASNQLIPCDTYSTAASTITLMSDQLLSSYTCSTTRDPNCDNSSVTVLEPSVSTAILHWDSSFRRAPINFEFPIKNVNIRTALRLWIYGIRDKNVSPLNSAPDDGTLTKYKKALSNIKALMESFLPLFTTNYTTLTTSDQDQLFLPTFKTFAESYLKVANNSSQFDSKQIKALTSMQYTTLYSHHFVVSRKRKACDDTTY